MVRDTIEYYPDYLQDFEYIKNICDVMDMKFGLAIIMGGTVKRAARLETYTDEWESAFEPGYHDGKKTAQMHLVKRYINVTAAELEDMMLCWLEKGRYKLTYDKDTNTVTVKSNNSHGIKEFAHKIRDAIPCNMKLVTEYVETL